MEVDADFTRSQRASSQIDLELTDLEVALESKEDVEQNRTNNGTVVVNRTAVLDSTEQGIPAQLSSIGPLSLSGPLVKV
jgi:hypothetical protein